MRSDILQFFSSQFQQVPKLDDSLGRPQKFHCNTFLEWHEEIEQEYIFFLSTTFHRIRRKLKKNGAVRCFALFPSQGNREWQEKLTKITGNPRIVRFLKNSSFEEHGYLPSNYTVSNDFSAF